MENSECLSQASNDYDSDVEMSEEECLKYSQEVKERFEDIEVQKSCRMALARMIILQELPFSSIQQQGFQMLMTEINPYFKIPTIRELGSDCVKVFLLQKEQMRKFFSSQGMGRVSITTECWASTEGLDFISVTAHCIDKEWKLHRKIISFSQLQSHSGEDVAAVVTAAVEEWGLQRVLCFTMKPENDVAIRHMKSVFDERNMVVIADGKYFHVRCVANIVTSVVCEGLAEIDMSVRRVREAMKWITAYSSRSNQFKDLAKLYKVDTERDLCVDIPTKWSSTYLMLEAALPYERVMEGFKLLSPEFVRDLSEMQDNEMQDDEMQDDDLTTIGVPRVEDWLAIKRMSGYLQKFHQFIRLVSDAKNVTAHLFFKEMCTIFSMIKRLERDEDDAKRSLATEMKTRLGKYWSEEKELNPKMNKILYIAALLDPRQKMKHVQLCLKTVYGDNRANELMEELTKSINDLFELYQKDMTLILGQTPTPATPMSDIHVPDDDDSNGSEITRYFAEELYETRASEVNHFDILQWWSSYGSCFPVLSAMARDIMAIPVSSVASKVAFNTEGRVLSEFRSSLPPRYIEALICAKNWLSSSSDSDDEDGE
ncbi:zinc finger BED domain-containing protein RICESLEEPER 2-like [Salvia splendens]|uniref:zinc finger BED domain-containing protein RICESLEEPER 2-like n=1 Tax=Salvia splendens TaxID=180675 RepID=UPI001C268A64|nr:zinc finger BED domain-containing protein RICESLEEPER 2-like [Salvia splendens]XP_042025723.1 zinc finger BED domain-containing protein RICESLEEPER 2-like [Salvia splendens]